MKVFWLRAGENGGSGDDLDWPITWRIPAIGEHIVTGDYSGMMYEISGIEWQFYDGQEPSIQIITDEGS